MGHVCYCFYWCEIDDFEPEYQHLSLINLEQDDSHCKKMKNGKLVYFSMGLNVFFVIY